MLPPFGLFAKIDARMSGLLGPRGLTELGEAASIDAVVQRLLQYPAYGSFVQPLAAEGMRGGGASDPLRFELQRALARKPVQDLAGLMPFATGERRALLVSLMRGFEVENVKHVLRRLVRDQALTGTDDTPSADRLPHDLGPWATVRLDRQPGPATVEELATLLEGTEYHPPVRDALGAFREQGTTFPIETALDDYLLAERWRCAGYLSGSERSLARALLGIEADLLAITWTYRGRFLHGLGAEAVLPRLPGFGRHLTAPRRRELVGQESPAEFATRVAAGPYASLVESDGTIRADRVDVRAGRLLLRAARGVRAGLRLGMNQALAFSIIVEREVRDIASIVECVHYGIARSEFGNHVAGWPA